MRRLQNKVNEGPPELLPVSAGLGQCCGCRSVCPLSAQLGGGAARAPLAGREGGRVPRATPGALRAPCCAAKAKQNKL